MARSPFFQLITETPGLAAEVQAVSEAAKSLQTALASGEPAEILRVVAVLAQAAPKARASLRSAISG